MKLWLTAVLFICCSAAHAAVWGYVDERGQVHLANTKVDDRYELFFNPASAPEPEKPSAKPQTKLHAKLVAFFASKEFLQIAPVMKTSSAKYGVEFELLQAVIAVESGYNRRAVSPKGALGLMQIMPDTAARFGIEGDKKRSLEDKLFDPKINIPLGARYLGVLQKMFPKRLDLTLAGYNAGENAVVRYKNTVPPYKETANYVQTISELYAALRPPEQQARAVNYVPSNVRLQMPLFNARRNMPEGSASLPPKLRGTITSAPPAAPLEPEPEEKTD